MTNHHIDIGSVADLTSWATTLQPEFRPGTRVGLCGPLGAGKTTFIQALVGAFGFPGVVDSPTFALRQTYPITSRRGVDRIIHVDLYRLPAGSHLTAIAELGLLDEWADPNSLMFIEWADRVPALTARLTHELTFAWDPASDRRTITCRGFRISSEAFTEVNSSEVKEKPRQSAQKAR